MNEIITKEKEFKDLVHVIRGQQVILDNDLAKLYGTEVKKLMQQVKRNIEKFPDDFMFQLTKHENVSLLKSQNVTSSSHGGKRKISYVFTEQGIYMVATILKNDIATQQSIYIMRSFKKMKHYLLENQALLNSTDLLEISNRLAKHEEHISNIKETMATKLDIEKVMDNFLDDEKIKNITILNGQKFEAIEAYTKIYRQANHSIFIIDDYISMNTLSLLKCKNENVEVTIFSDCKGNKDTQLKVNEINAFNDEYPTLKVIQNQGICHDRYIIIDYDTNNEKIYHCGASSKDAGNKVCGINQIENIEVFHNLIMQLLK